MKITTPILAAPLCALAMGFEASIAQKEGTPEIITGIRGNGSGKPPEIIISDLQGKARWTWTVNDAQTLPADLLKCMSWQSATDAKWTSNGHIIAAIYGDAAVLINHRPNTKIDKTIAFGICLDAKGMYNAHSLELVGGSKVAIANDNAGYTQSINIYDIQKEIAAYPEPIQQMDSISAVHALLWDSASSLMWAAGLDAPPSGSKPANSILNSYAFSNGSFNTKPSHTFQIAPAENVSAEYGSGYNQSWAGPHDMIGVPDKRKLIVTTDIDMHLFDIGTGMFEHGQAVADQYFAGFEAVDDRTGRDGKPLPRLLAITVRSGYGATLGFEGSTAADRSVTWFPLSGQLSSLDSWEGSGMRRSVSVWRSWRNVSSRSFAWKVEPPSHQYKFFVYLLHRHLGAALQPLFFHGVDDFRDEDDQDQDQEYDTELEGCFREVILDLRIFAKDYGDSALPYWRPDKPEGSRFKEADFVDSSDVLTPWRPFESVVLSTDGKGQYCDRWQM
ncbi:hypothetical protein PWT90_10202 [Aphanocladium album]|nr:hypothetical protein PWT90_10202 [Aphanocladium album]